MEGIAEIDLDNEIIENKLSVLCSSNSTLQLDDSVFSLPLKIKSFSSERELIAFVKNVERIVRSSIEYKLWVSYITDTLGQNKCVLSDEKLLECSLEVHHHPLTLYSIVKAVIDDFMRKEQEFSTFDIATAIMELHYQNRVGYIVLLSDLHKKYHNGFQKLPIDFVHGDYKFLLNNFVLDEEDRLNVMELCKITKEECKIKWSRDNYPGLSKD